MSRETLYRPLIWAYVNEQRWVLLQAGMVRDAHISGHLGRERLGPHFNTTPNQLRALASMWASEWMTREELLALQEMAPFGIEDGDAITAPLDPMSESTSGGPALSLPIASSPELTFTSRDENLSICARLVCWDDMPAAHVDKKRAPKLFDAFTPSHHEEMRTRLGGELFAFLLDDKNLGVMDVALAFLLVNSWKEGKDTFELEQLELAMHETTDEILVSCQRLEERGWIAIDWREAHGENTMKMRFFPKLSGRFEVG